MSKLIVETKKMQIGIRKVEEIEIYPLSFGQQRKFATKVGEMLSEFAEKSEENTSTVDMVNLIFRLIEQNLSEVVKMVADTEIDLDNISNDQVVELCTHIYDMNYCGAVKNLLSLRTRIQESWTKTQ